MLQKILTIVLVSILLLSLICIMRATYKSKNTDNHKNSSSLYAHFSQIDTYNYFKYPKLLFAHPRRFILTPGQGIYIPKKWWHWVTATTKTFAINYWFRNNIDIAAPFVIDVATDDIDVSKLDAENVTVWNSANNTSAESTFKTFYNSKQDGKYIITLANYNAGLGNSNIKKILHADVRLPVDPRIDVFGGEYDYNIWISAGKHTTGLHYDDEDGLLTVVAGTKELILFPPNDTKYLYAYDTTYKWAHTPPIDLSTTVIRILANATGFHPECYYMKPARTMCACWLTFPNYTKSTTGKNWCGALKSTKMCIGGNYIYTRWPTILPSRRGIYTKRNTI